MRGPRRPRRHHLLGRSGRGQSGRLHPQSGGVGLNLPATFSGQVVDTPTATEFTELALQRISEQELAQVASQLEAKSQAFQALLHPARLPGLSVEEVDGLLRSVFSTRRRADVLLSTLGRDGFVAHAGRLLWGDDPVGERLSAFHATVAGVGKGVHPSTGHDLGSEILHFTLPERHWLWTRWMWDPATGKGALPLVVMEEVDLASDGIGDTYQRVGTAVAFVNDVGEAAGFRGTDHGVFDTDVFLAGVYAVYMYTTLRIRMTQEFAKIMPGFGELLRRLLGVHRSPLLAEGPP